MKEDIIALVKGVVPNSARIVVVPEEKKSATASNIQLARTARGEDETEIGTVIAVGSGRHTESGEFIQTTSKVGDRVLLDRYAGVTIRVTRNGEILRSHEEITEDRLPVKIVMQESILWTFPTDWPPTP